MCSHSECSATVGVAIVRVAIVRVWLCFLRPPTKVHGAILTKVHGAPALQVQTESRPVHSQGLKGTPLLAVLAAQRGTLHLQHLTAPHAYSTPRLHHLTRPPTRRPRKPTHLCKAPPLGPERSSLAAHMPEGGCAALWCSPRVADCRAVCHPGAGSCRRSRLSCGRWTRRPSQAARASET